jgi:uncharacterized membrane protein HdeD (DUF308 family)
VSALEKITGQIMTPRRAIGFMGNVIAVLGLLGIGYPLTPATIRTMLLGWIMIAVGITQFIFGRHSHTTGSPATLRTVPVRSTDCERYR